MTIVPVEPDSDDKGDRERWNLFDYDDEKKKKGKIFKIEREQAM